MLAWQPLCPLPPLLVPMKGPIVAMWHTENAGTLEHARHPLIQAAADQICAWEAGDRERVGELWGWILEMGDWRSALDGFGCLR